MSNEKKRAILYDENLNPVLVVAEKTDWKDKTPNQKGRKRGVEYIKDPAKDLIPDITEETGQSKL